MRLPRLIAGVPALAATAFAAVPAAQAEQLDLSSIASNGSPEPVRTGFYAETSLGTFFTLGGGDSYSNVEAFLGLGLGYDITRWLAVGLQFQLAPSAGDCYVINSAGNDQCPAQGSSTFTMGALDLVVSGRIEVISRLFIPIRVFGGVADLTPLPNCNMANNACPVGSPAQVPSNAASDVWVPSFGLATGVEYATHFDHFTVGLEVSARYVAPGQLNMLALAIYPRIKYTF